MSSHPHGNPHGADGGPITAHPSRASGAQPPAQPPTQPPAQPPAQPPNPQPPPAASPGTQPRGAKPGAPPSAAEDRADAPVDALAAAGLAAYWAYDSRLEVAHEAAAQVLAFCRPLRFSEAVTLRVEISVYEAFVNAVEHAYQGQPGHEVGVAAEVIAQRLRLRVCQRGVPLDPAVVAAAPVGFDDLPFAADGDLPETRNRGLRIIKASMAGGCEVQRDGDWYCLVMTQPLPPAN